MHTVIDKNEFAFKLPQMASYHSTWDDADYEPALPRRRPSRIARLFAATTQWARGYAARRRTLNELTRMSDRDLADLGLSRYDIPRVFDAKFAAERDARV